MIDEIEHLYNLPHYNRITNNRNRHGGGLALFIKDNYEYVIRNDLNKQLEHIESLFIEISLKDKKNAICGVVYRRPGSNVNNFITDYETILTKINSENKNAFIMGDFNLNLLSADTCNQVESFVNLNHSKNFIDLIDKPTRVTLNSATIIDQIWSNKYFNVKFSGIIHNNITDHFPVFSFFNFSDNVNSINKTNKETITYREFNDSNFDIFGVSLLCFRS